jgi:putative hydroxymethylpyrimidine transport system permease protein
MAKQIITSPASLAMMKINQLLTARIYIPLLLIVIWECLIRFLRLPNYILPSPFEVFHNLINYASLIRSNMLATLVETLLGLSLAIILGILIALSMCLFRPIHAFFLPLLLASQALPIFAIAPLLVLWFGYGITAKILTTSFMLFFPIANNFLDGLKQTSENYLNLAHIMNSSRWQTLCQIRIPAALPNLASGIRIATAMAPLGAIIGEWVGSNQGLGFLLLNANAQMQIGLMFAILAVIFFFSILIYFLVDKLLYLGIPWTFSKSR